MCSIAVIYYTCIYMTGFAKTRNALTPAHNGKERFSSPIDSSINKLTNCHNTTATI